MTGDGIVQGWREASALHHSDLPSDKWFFGRAYTRSYLRGDKPEAWVSVWFGGMWHGDWDYCEGECEAGTLSLLRTSLLSLHRDGAPDGEEYWGRTLRTVLPVQVTQSNVEAEAFRWARTFVPGYITWDGDQF